MNRFVCQVWSFRMLCLCGTLPELLTAISLCFQVYHAAFSKVLMIDAGESKAN